MGSDNLHHRRKEKLERASNVEMLSVLRMIKFLLFVRVKKQNQNTLKT